VGQQVEPLRAPGGRGTHWACEWAPCHGSSAWLAGLCVRRRRSEALHLLNQKTCAPDGYCSSGADARAILELWTLLVGAFPRKLAYNNSAALLS